MRKLCLIVFIIFPLNTWANINYIDFYSIKGSENHTKEIDYLFKNIDLYSTWTPNWNSTIPKVSTVQELKEIYNVFLDLSKNSKNIEVFLALGDISHFLYNLDEQDYFEIAVNNYLNAEKISPTDYRCNWFLGNHYAMAARQIESVEQYKKAKDKLPKDFKISEFWENYAYAFNLAGMTSNCIYAMDQAKAILGTSCYLEKTLGDVIRGRLLNSFIDSTYKYVDFWNSSEFEHDYTCISRLWGLKVTYDKSWGSSFGDYKNRVSVLLLKPKAIKGYNNLDVTYTIALINRVPRENETLNDWVNKMISTFPIKNKMDLSCQYNNVIAYEIKAPSMYTDQGGGHMYIIGIEREPIPYSGINIEIPVQLKGSNNSGPSYYRLNSSLSRFEHKTQYLIMLDACESINKEALRVFNDFFNNRLIIE